MSESYVVTGVLTNGRLVELDERVPLNDAKVRVRVSIEPLPSAATRPLYEVIAEIRAEQAARGFFPPTRKEVDRDLADERESWDK